MAKEWTAFDDECEVVRGIVIQKLQKGVSVVVYEELQDNRFVEIKRDFRVLPLDYDIPGMTLHVGDAVEIKGRGQAYGGENEWGEPYDGYRFNCLCDADGYIKKLDIQTKNILLRIYKLTDNETIQKKIEKIINV